MKQFFNNISASQQLLLLVILTLSSWFLFSIVGTLVAILFWGSEAFTNTIALLNNPSFLKYFQVIQSIGLFIVPPILFRILTRGYFFSSTKFSTRLNKPYTVIIILLVILIVIAAQPFISFLGVFNNGIVLPDFMANIEAWMREKELQAQIATELFLTTSNWTQSLLNVVIIAILPAIGEELMFRGALQSILKSIFKNPHIAIFVTAAIFSAIHIQFFGFLPRFLLGVIFGYLMVFGKNIWLPILAHFINNFMAFLMYQSYAANNTDNINPLEAGPEYPDLIWVCLSILGTAGLLWLIKRIINKNWISSSSLSS